MSGNIKQYKNPLSFWDFDDCLLKSTDCKVIVNKPDGSTFALLPKQFYDYVLKPGETVDYGLFDNISPKPIIIKKTWKLFTDRIQQFGPKRVSILTARDNPAPVQAMLVSKGISPEVQVNAVGVYKSKENTTALNALNKKNLIHKRILENPNCDYIEFYDDNRLNIKRVQELRTIFPNIKIKTILVKH